MHTKTDSLGRVELVGDGIGDGGDGGNVGGILSTATDYANIGEPTPTDWSVTVYRQYKKRFGGELFWDRETGFSGTTADEARKKAQDYVRSQNWKLASGATSGFWNLGGEEVKPTGKVAVSKAKPTTLKRQAMGSGKYRLSVRQTKPEDAMHSTPYVAEIVEIGAKFPNQLIHGAASPELALAALMMDSEALDMLKAIADISFNLPAPDMKRLSGAIYVKAQPGSADHAGSTGLKLFSFSDSR
jgi:hypothetical protein